MGGTLEHWQYDTFITRFDDKNIEPAYVTFAPRRRRQGRAREDEGGIAARRLQLRLPGSRFCARGKLGRGAQVGLNGRQRGSRTPMHAATLRNSGSMQPSGSLKRPPE